MFFRKLNNIFIFILLLFSISIFIYTNEFPKPTGYVNDYANLIDSKTKTDITKLALTIKKNTGAEISVVTIQDIGNISIEEYAAELFKEWGIGQKGKDNGILIILALKQRKVRIEVGYGLEGDFPDLLMNKYLNNYAIPYFKNGNYSKGFYNLTYAIAKHFAEINGADFKTWIENINVPVVKTKKRFDLSSLFGLLFFFMFFVMPILGIMRRRYFYSRRSSNPLLWAMFFGGMSSSNKRSSFFNSSDGFSGFGGFGGGSSGGGGATGSF